MQVTFVKTIVLDDTHYIDTVLIDSKKYTFVMHKIEEPNVFGVLKQEEGFTPDTIALDLPISKSSDIIKE